MDLTLRRPAPKDDTRLLRASLMLSAASLATALVIVRPVLHWR
jgi:hypothetical protein